MFGVDNEFDLIVQPILQQYYSNLLYVACDLNILPFLIFASEVSALSGISVQIVSSEDHRIHCRSGKVFPLD